MVSLSPSIILQALPSLGKMAGEVVSKIIWPLQYISSSLFLHLTRGRERYFPFWTKMRGLQSFMNRVFGKREFSNFILQLEAFRAPKAVRPFLKMSSQKNVRVLIEAWCAALRYGKTYRNKCYVWPSFSLDLSKGMSIRTWRDHGRNTWQGKGEPSIHLLFFHACMMKKKTQTFYWFSIKELKY